MSAFVAEPSWTHDQPRRVGVVLVNLGTPDAPTAGAVRRYLAEFLSDRRVGEIPGFLCGTCLAHVRFGLVRTEN